MSKLLKIENCSECPFLKVGPLYSLDGFDRGCDWTCSKTNKEVAGFIERPSEEPKEIPKWCPLPKAE